MKDLITIAAEEYIDLWNKTHKPSIPYITSKFNLTGHTAGQFFSHNDACWFRWNLPLAEENSDDYLINTVGHEVAHLIAHKRYPNVASHGYEWQSIMRSFGLKPARCHNYKTTAARTVKRPYKYTCPCGEKHYFTITKFKNIVLSGITKNGTSNYACKCNTRINIKNIIPIT